MKRLHLVPRLRALVSSAAAMFFSAATLPALAACYGYGGTDICYEPYQYPPRYTINAEGITLCLLDLHEPPTEKPWSYNYRSVDEAFDFLETKHFCGRTAAQMNLCDGPNFPGRGTGWHPNSTSPDPVGYEPEYAWWTDGSTDFWTAFWFTETRKSAFPPPICGNEYRGKGILVKHRPIVCPLGTTLTSLSTNPFTIGCIAKQSQICPTGHPIQPDIGAKVLQASDFSTTGPLTFSRTYRSSAFNTPVGASNKRRSVLGRFWQTSYDSRLFPMPTSTTVKAALVRDDGSLKYFLTNGQEYPHFNGEAVETLTANPDGSWTLTSSSDRVDTYDAQGRLTSIWDKTSQRITLTYNVDDRLESVADSWGRSLTFAYASWPEQYGEIVTMTQPDGGQVEFRVDQRSNLRSVKYPDGKSLLYAYNSPNSASGVTGITDENGVLYEAVEYDTSGRATTSYLAPGTAGNSIGKHTFVYGGTSATITNPLGLSYVENYTTASGVTRRTSTSQPCSSCGTIYQTQSYDSNGYPDIATDFKGNQVNRDFDARGLETQRHEGIVPISPPQCPSGSTYYSSAYGSACTSGTCWASQSFPGSSSAAPLGYPGQYYSCTLSNAPLRTTQKIWHASLRQPVERSIKNAQNQTEAILRWEYNARGQVIAQCEVDPVDSATTCSATTAPPAGANVRRWVYSYCEAGDVSAPGSTCPIEGLLKSVNGPRATTDAGMGGLDDITTYTYYPGTDESGCGTPGGACHRKGDLWKVTNALGHVSENMAYDRNGRPVRNKDANGNITDMTYHARGWMLSRTMRTNANGSQSADDATTTFAYDDAGNVTRVTQPDGAYLNYSYDNAHRLTDVVDNLNNRIHYTLDAAGNRVKEDTYDASYTPSNPATGLKRSMSRAYNQLGQLTKSLNASSAATFDMTPFDGSGLNDGYDANGNDVLSQDGLAIETRKEYDPLNRLRSTIGDYLGTDPETGNATTSQTYDARDNIRTVTDPDSLATSYTYDGLNNLTDLDSPDTGHTDYAYDKAGNRISQTDNRGVTSTYTYDALNRLVGISYPTTSLNVTFAYDSYGSGAACTSYPIGKLTRMTDASGTTTYCYDQRGNVISKSHVAGSVSMDLAYTYDKVDRLKSITYPDGGVAAYTRDSVGRVTSLSWTPTGSTTTTVVSSATYYPFGPLNVLTYGNGRTLTKSYDADYAIDSIASSASDGLKLDFTVDVMGNIVAASDTIGATTPTRKYLYDHLYRLTRVDDGSDVMKEDYGYNKTGDRTLKQFAGQAAQVYSYLTGTHRLGSIDSANRTYDANGNTTTRGDGKTFAYDDRNRLTQVGIGSTQYFSNYNAKGERVSKFKQTLASQPLTRYAYDESGRLLTRRDPTSPASFVQYLYIDGTPVAQISGSTLTYLETDQLGTPRVAADNVTNAKQWAWDFFGSAFGEHGATGSTDIKLRYPGQAFDSESGLSYNYHRDYEPGAGRYIESDPVGLRAGLNTYAYVGSSPLTGIDPLGLAQWNGIWSMSFVNLGGGKLGKVLGTGVHHGWLFLTSECIRGQVWRVTVYEYGAGMSPGNPHFEAGSSVTTSVTLDDGNPMGTSPYAFNGAFTYLGASLGPYTPIGELAVGSAYGSAAGWSYFTTDYASLSAISGSATVTNAVPLPCGCNK